MLLGLTIGWVAVLAGIACLAHASTLDDKGRRGKLTAAGAVLCLLVAPGSCAGGCAAQWNAINHPAYGRTR